MLARAGLTVARLVVGRDDRAAHFATPEGDVLVVADGAGGTGSGAAAAEAVIAAVGASLSVRDARGWIDALTGVDARIAVGEATAVVCGVYGDRVVGASVGDSGAWRIADGAVDDLTRSQRHKPLLGSRRAHVVPFTAQLGAATLLLASDGLLKYASAGRIAGCVEGSILDAVARDLVDLVRLRSGALPDDVAVLLARRG